MPRTLCYLQPLRLEEWKSYFSFLRLVPGKILNKISPFFPAVKLTEIRAIVRRENIRVIVLGVPADCRSAKLVRKIDRLNPDLTFSAGAMPFSENHSGNPEINVITGYRARAVLFFQVFKKNLEEGNFKRYPKIFIWGADGNLGSFFVRLCAREYNTLTISGEDRSELQALAHSLMYETGASIKISANPSYDICRSDLVVMAKPYLSEKTFELNNKSDIYMVHEGIIKNANLVINKGYEIKGPAFFIEKGTRKKGYNFKWNFPLVEAISFMANGQYDLEQSWNIGCHEAKRLIERSGFRIAFKGDNFVVPIHS